MDLNEDPHLPSIGREREDGGRDPTVGGEGLTYIIYFLSKDLTKPGPIATGKKKEASCIYTEPHTPDRSDPI